MKTVFQGKFWTIKEREKTDPANRFIEMAERSSSVCVIPFTAEGKVVLLREFRKEHGKDVIGLIQGKADTADIEKEARKELAEEVNLQAKSLKLFHTSLPEEKMIWNRHYYVATGLEKTKETQKDEYETGRKMEPIECTLDEACNYALADNFRNELMGYVLLKLRNDLKSGKFKLP